MAKLKGIISKISGNKCIIITHEGEFRRVSLPRTPVRIGQEIEVAVSNLPFNLPNLRYASLAACLLLALVGLFSYRQAAVADPVAYISLDINPSLEIAVDENNRVVDISQLNPDSVRLLSNIEYQGKDVYQVLSDILKQAILLKYVTADRPNLVVSAIVPTASVQKIHLDPVRLQAAVSTPLGKSLKAGVVVFKAQQTDREQAERLQLSTGKYLFYTGAKQTGAKITVTEVKNNSIGSLVRAQKLTIPAPQRQVIVKYVNEKEFDEDAERDKVISKPGRQQPKQNNGQLKEIRKFERGKEKAAKTTGHPKVKGKKTIKAWSGNPAVASPASNRQQQRPGWVGPADRPTANESPNDSSNGSSNGSSTDGSSIDGSSADDPLADESQNQDQNYDSDEQGGNLQNGGGPANGNQQGQNGGGSSGNGSGNGSGQNGNQNGRRGGN